MDFHLAEMYEVETKVLKQTVKRNLKRFPSDFMFLLTEDEANKVLLIGVSQFVIPPDYNFGSTTPLASTELWKYFHNSHIHPGGNLVASDADLELTKKYSRNWQTI